MFLSPSDIMLVFWQHVWSRTSTGGDAYPGVALVPRACCHSPCLGVDALPGILLLCVCVCVCEYLLCVCVCVWGGGESWFFLGVILLHVEAPTPAISQVATY